MAAVMVMDTAACQDGISSSELLPDSELLMLLSQLSKLLWAGV